jgi:hypothetical protein
LYFIKISFSFANSRDHAHWRIVKCIIEFLGKYAFRLGGWERRFKVELEACEILYLNAELFLGLHAVLGVIKYCNLFSFDII